MARDPLATISTRRTPQTQRATGPEGARQTKNKAGGYVFQVDDDARLMRFLTLGTTGGTYYANERDHTAENANFILQYAENDGFKLVARITAVSMEGRAPKQNPALFALAVAASCSNDEVRANALSMLPRVARTATHLFIFLNYVQNFRGWGNALMKAVSKWYIDRDANSAAYQMLKYRQREGWTHRDVLRRVHPARWFALDNSQRALHDWVTHSGNSNVAQAQLNADLAEHVPAIVRSFERVQASTSVETWLEELERHNLSWEMLPDAANSNAAVWKAQIRKGMPITALMRQLPRLTRLGVLDDPQVRLMVTTQLQDSDTLRKGRVHPIAVLIALRTYASGRSVRGSSTWEPNRHVVDALDAAYYAAYDAIVPANKRTLVALDVSGSMGWGNIGDLPITPREASAALAMVTLKTEPESRVVGFTSGSRGRYSGTGISELKITPRQRLDDAVRVISNLPFGGTDCSLPMRWAMENNYEFDTFIVITDNETWAGPQQVQQSLREYRQKTGIAAREIVVGMTATECTIADPNDPLTLDVAGFDAAIPNIMADFSRGDL